MVTERRLITLIFADRPRGAAGIVVNRRELPLTSCASLVVIDGSHSVAEDSPFRVTNDLRPPYPAMIFLLYATDFCSMATPMAQMNPNSSRPTAVMTFCLHFSLAVSRV